MEHAKPWIGGKYDQGTFFWTDGSSISAGYISWGPGQPDNFVGNEHCMHLNPGWYTWNDIGCHEEYWSICEYDL